MATRAQPRTAARRGGAAPVPRDHVGVPRAAGAAEGRVPRARGHLHADRGAHALRPFGARAAAGLHRRGVPRGRGRRRADFGVVPIENSTEGTVNNTLDRFLSSPLKICGEVELRIHHFLMGTMSSLRRHQAHLLASAVARAVPRLARRAPAGRRARAGLEQRRRRAPRARRDRARRPSPGETAAEVYGLKVLAPRDRGPAGQHHALSRARAASSSRPSGEDRTTLLRLGGAHRRPGRAVPAARAARDASASA